MDFLLGSLTAGTGGDGMNLGSIENMEVTIVLLVVIKHLRIVKCYNILKIVAIIEMCILPFILGTIIDGMPCVPRSYYSSHQTVCKRSSCLY